MNSELTGKTLIAYSEIIAEKTRVSAGLSELGQILILGKKQPLAKFLSAKKNGIEPQAAANDELPTIQELNRAILEIEKLLTFSAKKAALDAIRNLVGFLGDFDHMSLESFLTRLKNAPDKPASKSVEQHIAEIKDSLKDRHAFKAAIDAVKANKSIKKAQLILIAESITGFPQKGTIPDLYMAIEQRHKNYFDALQRQQAAGGKSAA